MDEVSMRLEEVPLPVKFVCKPLPAANDNHKPFVNRIKRFTPTLVSALVILGLIFLVVWLVTP
ncbi:MAG: hypothetical protein LBD15_04100 [Holosporales bacterium]|jgi:hypothetical protein|nr:hypothetical protein [Holosporales bacterium]